MTHLNPAPQSPRRLETPVYTLEFEKPLRDLTAQLDGLRRQSMENNLDLGSEIAAITAKIEVTQRSIYSNLTPWQRVQIARHPKRPYALNYVNSLCTGFQELHGDRQFRDDQAFIGGTAFFNEEPVMIIAQQKGRAIKEKITRNFGMPQPEGYRKALRLMKLAEKFGIPVFCFIDTSGAYPGIGSEERHVSEAIAVNFREMAMLRVPSISVVVGEGGSGGALGIGVTDRVLIFENSYYSVISPEGCCGRTSSCISTQIGCGELGEIRHRQRSHQRTLRRSTSRSRKSDGDSGIRTPKTP